MKRFENKVLIRRNLFVLNDFHAIEKGFAVFSFKMTDKIKY